VIRDQLAGDFEIQWQSVHFKQYRGYVMLKKTAIGISLVNI